MSVCLYVTVCHCMSLHVTVCLYVCLYKGGWGLFSHRYTLSACIAAMALAALAHEYSPAVLDPRLRCPPTLNVAVLYNRIPYINNSIMYYTVL